MLLEDEGYLVKAVSTGNQALAAVRDFAADVLLLDISMPDMSGYEVARTLRERYGSAKPALIAITARISPADKSLANITSRGSITTSRNPWTQRSCSRSSSA